MKATRVIWVQLVEIWDLEGAKDQNMYSHQRKGMSIMLLLSQALSNTVLRVNLSVKNMEERPLGTNPLKAVGILATEIDIPKLI